MTLKERRFAEEFSKCGNGAAAARKAGYSEHTARQIATENLAKPYIRQYIDELIEDDDTERIADAREVLRALTAIVRDEEAANRDRIRAVEVLAKIRGFSAPERQEIAITETEARPRVQIYLPKLDEEPQEDIMV